MRAGTAKERDSLLKSTFDRPIVCTTVEVKLQGAAMCKALRARFGFEPVQEIVDNPLQACCQTLEIR